MTTHTTTTDAEAGDDVAVGCNGCLPVVAALIVLWGLFIGAVVMVTLAVAG